MQKSYAKLRELGVDEGLDLLAGWIESFSSVIDGEKERQEEVVKVLRQMSRDIKYGFDLDEEKKP